MQLAAHDLEARHTDTIQDAIDAFRRRAGLLCSAVFLIRRRSGPECIADCGDFPLELGLERLGVRPGHGCLTDVGRRFLLVWFHAPTIDNETVLGPAKDAASKIADVLDQLEARHARYGHQRRGRR